MSEAVNPEYSQFEAESRLISPNLQAVAMPDEPNETIFSVNDFINPEINPIARQTSIYILDNRKIFDGHTLAGETIPPNREAYLRGVRNVLANFAQYHSLTHTAPSEQGKAPTLVSSDKLIKESHRLLSYRRKTGSNSSQSVLELTSGAQQQIFQLYLELVTENDPLAVTLAQVHRETKISEKSFYELCLDTMVCFQPDRFKQLLGLRVIPKVKPQP